MHNNMNINFRQLTLSAALALAFGLPANSHNSIGHFDAPGQTRFYDGAPSKGYAIISRYRLEPKDPKAYKQGKTVEPKKQTVYYIDPATPKKWVPYLIAGINDWNAAFEAAGFKNAIAAREIPKGSDISPDDAQYCFLRYLPSETENAYGPRIVDPRSGEIIESHICWYHNVMNLVRKWYITQCRPLDKRAQTMQLPDKLMGELIRFVSSHEVGHTLGLRHNMIASSATPVEKLRDKKWVEANGHTASIMDYARFNRGRRVGARTIPTHQCLRQVGNQMGLSIPSGIQGSMEGSQAAAHGGQRALRPYPVQEYLTDLFHAVWKPLGKEGDKQDYYRRQLERTYVNTLNQDINADPSKDKSTFSLNASNSDARLFLLQHLDTVESFCRMQQAAEPASSLDALHYNGLIHDIEMIRKNIIRQSDYLCHVVSMDYLLFICTTKSNISFDMTRLRAFLQRRSL